MSGQHTPGRLVVEPAAGSNLYHVQMDGIRIGQLLTLDAARRLAACWNACEGLSTEGVEMIAECGGMLQAGANSRAIEANYEAARALLSDILAADDAAYAEIKELGLSLESDATSGAPELTERIRAFLKGGA